jgi:3-oxoacyl-[acyl-carrier protein] reductase
MRLKDRVAIITGAGRGIGREYALRFADEGAKVVIPDIVFENAQKVAGEVEAKGGQALALHTDVSDESSTQEMAKTTMEKFGRIDILVNNAAIYWGIGYKAWEAWSVEEWDRMYKVNVIGAWLCAKAVTPHMIDQGKGKIICVSSATVDIGFPLMLAYTCSKGAIVTLTKCLAWGLGDYGINVNCLTPGLTMSDATLEMPNSPPGVAEYAASFGCIKRLEQPTDLVGTAVFLASDDSDFVTGQTIMVDGGIYKK